MISKDSTRSLVLVVDDNAHIRNAIRDILNTVDIDILHARNGREGVTQFQTYREHIDAVVLDIHMPLMNGEEVLAAIRAIDSEVPVLVSSSYGQTEIIAEKVEEKKVRFLRKPYTFRSLKNEVQRMLNSAETTPPHQVLAPLA